MNGPERKRNVPAEATQELQALDVLEIVETLQAKPGSGARRPVPSNSSIAPVGLDLMPQRGGADEEVNPTMQVRLPMRRRRLGGIVIAAVAGCALILVAAGIARVGHASSEPSTAAASSRNDHARHAPRRPPQRLLRHRRPLRFRYPHLRSRRRVGRAPGRCASTSRPRRAGLARREEAISSSALVSCGTHQIKVGRSRTHSIDVPCGGEIGVAR